MRSPDGETALGIDLFDWPNPEVIDRFEANCLKHGVPAERRVTWKADSRTMTARGSCWPSSAAGARASSISTASIRGLRSRRDLELATAVLAPAGVIVLDDMLHPGYPTLMVAVHEYLGRHPDMCVLAIIDRETVVAATKFVLCRTEWFKRYEEKLLEAYQANVWPLGADFEPHWCLVLSLDTKTGRHRLNSRTVRATAARADAPVSLRHLRRSSRFERRRLALRRSHLPRDVWHGRVGARRWSVPWNPRATPCHTVDSPSRRRTRSDEQA